MVDDVGDRFGCRHGVPLCRRHFECTLTQHELGVGKRVVLDHRRPAPAELDALVAADRVEC